MKKFNLEKAKSGEDVVTRRGNPVRITCFDRTPTQSSGKIIALIKNKSGKEYVRSYSENGKCYPREFAIYDLFMKSKIKIGFVNIYRIKVGGYAISRLYESKKEATKNICVIFDEFFVKTKKIKL